MDPLTIALVLLWAVVLALGIVTIALARQIGILFERVAPMGALMTDSGPKIGEASPKFALLAVGTGKPISIGASTGRSLLIFFLSPTCPVCKKLLPVLKSAQKAEAQWLDIVLASDGEKHAHEAFIASHKLNQFPYVLSTDLGMAYRVGRLPYGVVLDGEGTVRAKGLINNREQLESLFNAKEMGVASIQGFLEGARQA
jgi:methylamine dehydrogenase accessory protein MauD